MKVFPKRWSLLFGIIALQTTASFAQSGWTRQESGTTYTLNSVSFVDANTGTAVGGHGTILRTTDGGDTWTQQESGTTAILYGVSFADAKTGTAVGEGGLILRTTDGGETWTRQQSGWSWGMTDVYVVDADRATAVDANRIFQTSDGGDTWTVLAPDPFRVTDTLYRVSFADANHGMAVGSRISHPITRYNALVARTDDGGASWSRIATGPAITLHALASAGADTWFAAGHVGGGTTEIYRSTDFGQTWTSQYVANAGVQSISFGDAKTGTAVGFTVPARGLIVRTIDGGDTWTEQESGTTAFLTSVSFVDANTGTAVGDSGIILRTTTGGE